MDAFSYVWIPLTRLLAGAAAGFVGGLLLGYLLMLSYHKGGPHNIADAPVYVAAGLMLLGTFVGSLSGLVIGIIQTVRMARRKVPSQV